MVLKGPSYSVWASVTSFLKWENFQQIRKHLHIIRFQDHDCVSNGGRSVWCLEHLARTESCGSGVSVAWVIDACHFNWLRTHVCFKPRASLSETAPCSEGSVYRSTLHTFLSHRIYYPAEGILLLNEQMGLSKLPQTSAHGVPFSFISYLYLIYSRAVCPWWHRPQLSLQATWR